MGLPTLSLWAAVPHYLAANPNPKAMLALLQGAAGILEFEVDTAELTQVATEFTGRVDEAMAENEAFVSYVQRLEAESGTPISTVRSGDGDQLITEIEQFLRNRDD